ncbi:MAG: DUF86 domain-containing protein [Bacteroidota bacterium]|nr:DUF86 domain-containing protein [Bacteroidota bacterium]
MTRSYSLYLNNILEAINRIARFIAEINIDEFLRDDKTKSAVVWNVEIIGEAAKQIPKQIRQRYKDIPWNDMAKMRDKISHAYFGVRYEIVWNVAKERLPLIKPTIEKIISEIKGGKLFKE